MIKSLDGLRAASIIVVLLSHLGFPVEGKIGVEIFFVISGYLITNNLLTEKRQYGNISFRNFYIRRFARLYPTLLLISILTSAFLIFIREFGHNEVYCMLAMLSFSTDLLIWLTPIQISNFFNFTWSLGVEEQFYLIWPIIMVMILRKLRNSFLYICIFLMGTFFISFIWRTLNTGGEHSVEILYFGPIAHLGALAGGSLIAFPKFTEKYLRLKKRFPKIVSTIVWSLALVLIYISHYKSPIPFGLDESSLLLASVAAILLVTNLVCVQNDLISKILKIEVLVLLGKLSYTLYLLNIIFIETFEHFTSNNVTEMNTIEKIFLLFCLCNASFIIYRFYEMPLRIKINSKQVIRNSDE